MPEFTANKGKQLTIKAKGIRYTRIPIKTHVISNDDEIEDVAERYALPLIKKGDILFISKKSVSCTQSRAIKISDIRPGRLARILAKHVKNSPADAEPAMPETVEMILRECGVVRILFADAVSSVCRLLKKKDLFYKIAGRKASSIDGPSSNSLHPYDECVVLGPKDPDEVAYIISKRVGTGVIIVDINNYNAEVLGASDQTIDRNKMADILKDNPLGQTSEQTPMGIIRKMTISSELR